jgi:hypothetical protein
LDFLFSIVILSFLGQFMEFLGVIEERENDDGVDQAEIMEKQ